MFAWVENCRFLSVSCVIQMSLKIRFSKKCKSSTDFIEAISCKLRSNSSDCWACTANKVSFCQPMNTYKCFHNNNIYVEIFLRSLDKHLCRSDVNKKTWFIQILRRGFSHPTKYLESSSQRMIPTNDKYICLLKLGFLWGHEITVTFLLMLCHILSYFWWKLLG